jgi:Tfp pilus assembly protein PilN
LRRLVSVQFLKSTFEILVIACALSGMILLAGNWFLEQHVTTLAGHITSITTRNLGAHDDIKEVNTLIKKVDQIQRSYLPITPTLTEISTVIPPDVRLNTLALSTDKSRLNISGTARVQQDLLDLGQALETLPFIEQVDIPLSQAIKQKNLSFSLSIPLTL